MSGPAFRTVFPPEGTEPVARDPASARAAIGSTAAEALREYQQERDRLVNRLRVVCQEMATLQAVALAAGVEYDP